MKSNVRYCTESENLLKGYFLEISNDAGSNRSEQLGMYAVHHFITALLLFYSIERWNTKSCYDNEVTMKISRRRLIRIRWRMSYATFFAA